MGVSKCELSRGGVVRADIVVGAKFGFIIGTCVVGTMLDVIVCGLAGGFGFAGNGLDFVDSLVNGSSAMA